MGLLFFLADSSYMCDSQRLICILSWLIIMPKVQITFNDLKWAKQTIRRLDINLEMSIISRGYAEENQYASWNIYWTIAAICF